MDSKYKNKNRVYGVIVIAVLAVLIFMVSTKEGGGKWFDNSKRIAVLPLEGEINSSRKWISSLQKFAENDRVGGILIPINSPGGQVAPSQELYHAIKAVRDNSDKPIFVSMSSVAASGGYYAALGADSIFANDGTLTGSIGVIMQFPIYSDLMEKVGVGMRTVKSQEFKDAGSPFREMNEQEQAYFQGIINDVYEQFTEVVSQERGIDEINMQSLGNGRVFTGRQAFKANLVDALGTFEDARKALCIKAGIPQNSRLQYPLEPRRSWWTILKDDVSSALPGWESSSSIKLQYRIPY
ncbi:MAG: signal peptide peptidase SppA [Candidatus Marinimicrobia bacterium]|jgi:protease-4|nr:signal peptide peptidase SppA [Candidatus Neomarinimicrobiota bacterium]MBT3574521.1 signal peptide peptidase SppA [Candidatus Neomarinimicrobiota bacterium]MBT3678728.1 signal peptide peptidase SppA [Candidatus Neomarinimicrobiota bacterium]MBT3952213.1 signal peptide peptidase SppA [Candidatus Neomarinimicrobiota bacterium]MBT4252984.1 signal peptide peptidase SppA [Candidatus Neomarinimicrobiota bacterium]